MKKKVAVVILSAIVLAGFLIGCVNGSGTSGGGPISLARKDYADQPNGILTINNQTKESLAIFVGRVEQKKLVGAVGGVGNVQGYSSSRSFDLSGHIGSSAKSGSLLVRAVSVSKVLGKSWPTEEDVLYTGLVVYNLDNPRDKTNLNIHATMDETMSTSIYASNMSRNFVLELRLNSPTGDKIATLAPEQERKRIWLRPAPDGLPFKIYPTYVYVDPETNEITSIVERGRDKSEPVMPVPLGESVTPKEFFGPNTGSVAYNVAFLLVQNDSGRGISLMNGQTVLADQKGKRFTDSGLSGTYEIPSEMGSEGQVYNGLKIDDYRDAANRPSINSYTFKPGFVYQLLIVDRSDGSTGYDIAERGQKNKLNDARINLLFE